MTLIDSRPQTMGAFEALAAETGVAIDLAEVNRRLGIKLEDEIAYWFPPDQQVEAVAGYRRHYIAAAEDTRALPGAADAIAAVRASGGTVVIITAKHPVSVGPSLTAAGLAADEVYAHVHGAEKAAVLRKLRASAYVGDSPPDVAAARDADALAIGVATGSFAARDLYDAGADVVLGSMTEFAAWYQAQPRLRFVQGRGHVITDEGGVHQQRPGLLADPHPQRGQQLHAVPPRRHLVGAELGLDAGAEPPCVTAVVTPSGQEAGHLSVGAWQRPVAQPLRDLSGRVDDERVRTGAADLVHPSLAAGPLPDAGRREPGAGRQRRDHVPGLVPRGDDRRCPGRPVRRLVTAGIPLPDPLIVHDRLVIVTDEAVEFGPDISQHRHAVSS
jgi:phosphoglycolate phosphatase